MSSTARVTVERLDEMGSLAERAAFMSINTGSGSAQQPSLQRNSLSRYEYSKPKSPCSPHSPRIGEVWRTGQASSHGGWFRPSPSAVKQPAMQQQ